jgi:protein SCO1
VTDARLQRLLLLVLVSLLAAIGVVLVTSRRSHEVSATQAATKSKFEGPEMPPGLRAADFSLLDQNSRRVTLSQYRGHVVILTFIHSLCHDACPFMVEQIKGALNDLPNSGRGVPAIGISVDPAEDTRANRLRFLAKHEMSGRLAFLNAPRATMRRVWHAYAMQPVQGPIDHSTFVLLIDKRGIERVGFAADQLTPEELAHDIRVLQAEPT